MYKSDFKIENGVLEGYVGNETKVRIPDGVEIISSSAFGEAEELMALAIVPSVKTVCDFAFSYKHELKKVITSDGLELVGECAFFCCEKLMKIDIPKTVSEIGELAFYHCVSIKEINVDSGNQNYKSVAGDLYTKDGRTLVQYALGKPDREFAVPKGVETVGNNAFEFADHLRRVSLPDGVREIGEFCFFGMKNVESIIVPPSVTVIDDDAFVECDKLVICGAAGSYVEKFAKKHKIDFIAVEL
jgi:hypothetical protein